MLKSISEIRIAIIGAGIAGLAAAQNLYEYGFKNITVFEAMDRVGGRIHTINDGDGFIELGASWLHGEEGNVLYDIAKERRLILDPQDKPGVEGDGKFLTENGDQLDYEDVKEILIALDTMKDELLDTDDDDQDCELNECEHERAYQYDEDDDEYTDYSEEDCVECKQKRLAKLNRSVGELFREKFSKYISKKQTGIVDRKLLWSIFNWFQRFEKIDNACSNLDDISAKAYTEWIECDGVSLINFKDGFQSVIKLILNYLPKDLVKLNKQVKLIDYSDADRIKIQLENDTEDYVYTFDHVIITCSIGVLQSKLATLFKPNLPERKAQAINLMGFGTIDKIYLHFEKPFWKQEDLGFQLIWLKNSDNGDDNQQCNKINDEDEKEFPKWVYDISGFDVVRDQKNFLLAWIGGDGAIEMEEINDDQLIADICKKLLRKFLKNFLLNLDDYDKQNVRIIRSKWKSNEHVKGAYSHPTVNLDKNNLTIDDLSTPIIDEENLKPRLLFAGEATERNYFSTAHGALQSGLREAQRLIDFYLKF